MSVACPSIERDCPICGPGASSRIFAAERISLEGLDAFAFASRKLPEYMHLRLHECRECGVLFASPVFDGRELAAAYRDAAYDSAATARLAARTYGRLVRSMKAMLPSRHGVLDVGAGDGAFLAELLQAGFSNVVGVEPSRAPVDAADSRIRNCLRHEMFSPDSFAPASFSLITCFQTIEHLEDPLGFCRDAARLLRPGGALMLVGHNRFALSARLLGQRSPIYDLEHLQLFSPQSFTRLLDNAGLDRITVKPLWNRYPLSYWVRLFPLSPARKAQLGRLCTRARIDNVLLPLPAGNMVALAFRRQ